MLRDVRTNWNLSYTKGLEGFWLGGDILGVRLEPQVYQVVIRTLAGFGGFEHNNL